MNIKVAAFTLSEKSINTRKRLSNNKHNMFIFGPMNTEEPASHNSLHFDNILIEKINHKYRFNPYSAKKKASENVVC